MKKYIEMIQKLSKQKMWFARTNDRTKHMGSWFQLDKIPHEIQVDYRTVLPNELIFECDLNWDSIRFSHRILTEYLEKKNIPYYLFDSGGKGLHQHVFCEYNLRKLSRYEKWFGKISTALALARLLTIIGARSYLFKRCLPPYLLS